MALIIDGQHEEIPGLTSLAYTEEPRLRLKFGEDSYKRPARDIRGIVLHTTKGVPGPPGTDQRRQVIRQGLGPRVDAGLRCARFWATTAKKAGAHLVVDFDGTVCCCADLMAEAANHAGAVNAITIGVEIYQGEDAELYEGQLDAVVRLCDYLTRRFGIQRQIPGERYAGPIPRLADGRDFYGVYGHRDVSATRGMGDPGSAIFVRLGAAGYEPWDVSAREDVAAWKPRQMAHNVAPADGVPGPRTVAQLRAASLPHGMWVRRPGDELNGQALVG